MSHNSTAMTGTDHGMAGLLRRLSKSRGVPKPPPAAVIASASRAKPTRVKAPAVRERDSIILRLQSAAQDYAAAQAQGPDSVPLVEDCTANREEELLIP